MKVQTSYGTALIKVFFDPPDRRKRNPTWRDIAFFVIHGAVREDRRKSKEPYRRRTVVQVNVFNQNNTASIQFEATCACSPLDRFEKSIGRFLCLQQILNQQVLKWNAEDRARLWRAICPVVPADFAAYYKGEKQYKAFKDNASDANETAENVLDYLERIVSGQCR